MKTKKMKLHSFFLTGLKQLMVFAFLMVLAFPSASFALDWGVAASTNGNVAFGIGSNGSMSGGWSVNNVYGLPGGSIMGIVSNILFWLLSLFALTGIIGFVLSGIFYLISAGEEDMIKRGKEGMKWSIVGILVGLSGFIIMQAVNMMLNGNSKSF
ncbi:MAG: hypothetical protein WCJ51_01770 [Candidatus Moraniibacteriota bacterium]